MKLIKMILLEEHIELRILHYNSLLKFDILERLTDKGIISFKVMYTGGYVFTLVTRNDQDFFGLELSEADREFNKDIDWDLYSKIVVSLYSVFLNEEPS